jgi:alpha 1,6-mannosyltransferase
MLFNSYFLQRGLLVLLILLGIVQMGKWSYDGKLPTFRSNRPAGYPKHFPRKIWQLWKTPLGQLDDDTQADVVLWSTMNPDHRWELITDGSQVAYVREHFANRPRIIEAYGALRDAILRADFLRYLVLLAEGGVYIDIDTKPLKPINSWIPPQYEDDEINLLVGMEVDHDGPKWLDWTYNRQICQWALYAKPNHPIIENVVMGIVNQTLSAMDMDFTHLIREKVLNLTGPGAFTNAVFAGLSQMTATNVTAANVTNLSEPKLIGDVLVMTINAFGSGQGHSNSQPPQHPDALVFHRFRGSWFKDHHYTNDDKKGDKREAS